MTLIIVHESIGPQPLPFFSCFLVATENLQPSIIKPASPFGIDSPWEKLSNKQNMALDMEGDDGSLISKLEEFHH